MALWRRMVGAEVKPTPDALAAVLGACKAALQGERALALLAEARAAGAPQCLHGLWGTPYWTLHVNLPCGWFAPTYRPKFLASSRRWTPFMNTRT